MKKILLLSFVSAILLTSCDYVDVPNPAKNPQVVDPAGCPTPTFPIVTTHVRKILLEDYTGHTCGNCPNAANELQTLENTYSGRVIPLAVHITDIFAAPSPGYLSTPMTSFLADYRTTVGDEYNTKFNVPSLPNGMINRAYFNSVDGYFKKWQGWSTYISNTISNASFVSDVDLQIMADYDASTRKICFSVKDSFLTTMTDTLKLVVVLAQDSIIDWQDVGGVPDPNYVFRHVLRDVITPHGAWGESLVNGTVSAGTMHTNTFAYTIPTSYSYTPTSTGIPCDPNQCHLIVFIYRKSNYEVIQVEEIKLID